MRTITAAVCRAFSEPLRLEKVRLAAPGPGQVEVDIEACAICHSDISFADGSWGGALPAVYGHEAVGRITALGSGVQDLTMGTRVLVTLIKSCGTCLACANGQQVHCRTRAADQGPGPLSLADGGALSQGMDCGAFAQACVVDQSQVALVPETIPVAAACLLSCGVITGLGAVVNTARVRPGQTVVVIGAGGVGLNAIQGARIAGAARIIAVDMSQEKLATAREFGATDGILGTEPDPWSSLSAIAPNLADVVIVTVGTALAYDTSLNYLGVGGQMIMVGMPKIGASASYEPVNTCYFGQGMQGSKMGDCVLRRDIPWIVDLYAQGRLKLDELVSGQWRLDQINEAIADTRSGAARRNVIVFA